MGHDIRRYLTILAEDAGSAERNDNFNLRMAVDKAMLEWRRMGGEAIRIYRDRGTYLVCPIDQEFSGITIGYIDRDGAYHQEFPKPKG